MSTYCELLHNKDNYMYMLLYVLEMSFSAFKQNSTFTSEAFLMCMLFDTVSPAEVHPQSTGPSAGVTCTTGSIPYPNSVNSKYDDAP